MEEPTGHPPGLFASVKRLGRIILLIAQNRLELLLVEVEEERRRAIEVLLLTLIVAALGLMTLMVGTFAVVVMFWDDHRLVVLGFFSLFYLLATGGVYWRLRKRLHEWPSFSATVAELKKDKAWLERER